MDMQFTTSYRPRLTDYPLHTNNNTIHAHTHTAHNTHRGERERLDSITQLVSTITLVTQSIASAYRRDTAEGDRLVECVVELSRRALAEVRAWPARNATAVGEGGADLSPVISHALSRAMNTAFAANRMATETASASASAVGLGGSASAAVSADELAEGHALLQSLTARERDMLRLIVKGMSNKEIAHELHLTEGTVKGYVSHMLSKLNVADRTQAALFAVRFGV